MLRTPRTVVANTIRILFDVDFHAALEPDPVGCSQLAACKDVIAAELGVSMAYHGTAHDKAQMLRHRICHCVGGCQSHCAQLGDYYTNKADAGQFAADV